VGKRVRQSSKDAWKKIKENGLLSWTRWKVYHLLYMNGPLTGREINDIHKTNSGHKRLSELRNLGVVQEAGKKICSITGMNVIAWDVTDRLPIALPDKDKPIMTYTIEVFPDGNSKVKIKGTPKHPTPPSSYKYANSSFAQQKGVKKSGEKLAYNGKGAMQLNLWTGTEKFSLKQSELDT